MRFGNFLFVVLLLNLSFPCLADETPHAPTTPPSNPPAHPVIPECDDFSQPVKSPPASEVPNKSPVVQRNILQRDLLLHAVDYREPLKVPTPDKFEGKKGNLVYFVKSACPLARLYAPKLQELINEYKKDFNVFVVFPSPEETEAMVKKSPLGQLTGATLVMDPLSDLATFSDVTISPTAVLFDGDFNPVFQGPLDDQFGIGYRKNQACKQYVKKKMRELQAGIRPPFEKLPTQGCEFDFSPAKKENCKVSYHSGIKQIIERGRCLSCHQEGNIAGQYPLGTYEDLKSNAATAATQIRARRMPPVQIDPRFGEFHDVERLSPEDIQAFTEWVQCEMPEGKKAPGTSEGSRPPLKETFKPDLVLSMSAPKEIDATGIMPYQYELIDPKFTEDKWVSSAKVIPGNLSVVHHVRTFVIPPDLVVEKPGFAESLIAMRLYEIPREQLQWSKALWGERGQDPSETALGSYTPGTSRNFPEGMGVFIPKGSKILFELHYTPNGESGQTDLSRVELKFSKTPAKHQILELPLGPNIKDLKILPDDRNAQMVIEYELPKKADIVSFRPHMHMRGKSYKVERVRPGKEPETLISIPYWDYKWQSYYELKKPLRLEKGEKIRVTAVWDNSAENPSVPFHPDPEKPEGPGIPGHTIKAHFGPNIHNEMAFAYINLVWAE